MNVFIYNKDYDFSDSLFCEEIDATADDGEKFVRHADAESQLAALREELASAKADKDAYAQNAIDLRTRLDSVKANSKQLAELDDQTIKTLGHRLADAERRNALPADWADQLFSEMERRFELSKQYHQDHLVNDDTQIGVEFAIEWITAALNPNPEAASHDE